MSERTKEEIYDEEIAPVLLDLSKKCKEYGINLVALAEYAPGQYGSTAAFDGTQCLPLQLAQGAAMSGLNMDKFIGSYIIPYAKKNGHSSLYISQLGVPVTPQPSN